MKAKIYLTTLALTLYSLVSVGQMAETQFSSAPSASDSADVVNFKFTTSLQTYVLEYILCRTVDSTTVEIGRQDGFEYNPNMVSYTFVDPNPVHGQNVTYTLKMVDNMDTTLVTTVGTVMHTFTSINDVEPVTFEQVYPNPVLNRLNVRIERQKETSWLEIRDLTGQLVISVQVSAGQQSLVLDMEEIPSGPYTLSLRTGKGVGTKMIIKH